MPETEGPRDPILIPRREAAGTIGVPHRTFSRLERAGRGPARVEIGARVYYRLVDLEAWVDGLRVVREPAS